MSRIGDKIETNKEANIGKRQEVNTNQYLLHNALKRNTYK